MKIAVPVLDTRELDAQVSEHFGRAPAFMIVDLNTKEKKVVPNDGEHFGGTRVAPEILADEGVEVVLCSGLGPRAINMFEQFGIEVYVGASGTVKDAIEAFQSGLLHKASDSDACEMHRH